MDKVYPFSPDFLSKLHALFFELVFSVYDFFLLYLNVPIQSNFVEGRPRCLESCQAKRRNKILINHWSSSI